MANSFSDITQIIYGPMQDTLRSRGAILSVIDTTYSDVAVEIGDTINVTFPPTLTSLVASSSHLPDPGQDATPTKVQIVMDQLYHSSFTLTDKQEFEIPVSDYLAKTVQTATEAVLVGMETAAVATISGSLFGSGSAHTYSFVGSTALTRLSGSTDLQVEVWKNLFDEKAPDAGRSILMDSTRAALVLGYPLLQKLNESGDRSLLRQAQFGTLAGIDHYTSNFLAGSSLKVVGLHKQAFGAAVRPGRLGDESVQVRDPISGVEFTFSRVRQNRQWNYEISVLYGFKKIRPQWITAWL